MKVDGLLYIWPLGHETTSVAFIYFRFSEIFWWDSDEKFKVFHDANGTRTCRKRATHDRWGRLFTVANMTVGDAGAESKR